MFDCTNKGSLTDADDYILETSRYCEENIPVILIGTKSDLENEREISRKEALDFANARKIPYFESAQKESVENAFVQLADMITGIHLTRTVSSSFSFSHFQIIDPNYTYNREIEFKSLFFQFSKCRFSLNRDTLRVNSLHPQRYLDLQLPVSSILSIKESKPDIFTIKAPKNKVKIKCNNHPQIPKLVERGMFYYWWQKRWE